METVSEKANRLLAGGRITELVGARTFSAVGDSGNYLVTLTPEGMAHCTCPAEGTNCSHIVGALRKRGGA